MHTPGSWNAVPYWNGWSIVASAEVAKTLHAQPIADVHFPVDVLRAHERAANATSMAAAPELIERLVKRIESCHGRGDQYGSPGQCAECKADQAVIDKARGRSPNVAKVA